MANKHSVKDDGDSRKYYAAIPNIVFKIGLNPYELVLYVYLKKVAGEDGVCWKSTASIAKDLGIGAGTVSRTKALLALPRADLGGKPLIVITSEMQNGGNANHAITMTDIWPENMAELSRVRAGKASRSTEGARVPETSVTPSTQEPTRSTGGDKEDPFKNNSEEDRNAPDFLSTLKTNPAYSHVDVGREVFKMQAWLALPANKGRKLTSRFILNWLNKIDRPLAVGSNGNGARAAAHYVPNDAKEVCVRCYNTGTETTPKGSRPCDHKVQV